MAFRLDVANHWIRVDFIVAGNHHEDTADHLVKTMNNYASRTCIKIGTLSRLTHIEMPETLFDQIERVQSHFPAFRITAFRTLRTRNVLGTLCGVTVYRNDKLDNCIHFQYTDALAQPNESLPDPAYINHPKGAPSPFIYS
ncbi:hypothetical protein D3C85_552630 [compost metagenome]